MSSQGASRKRPAPGTNPEVSQQMPLVPNYDSVDSQLSNDQFLQWGQNGQNTNIINLDLPSYVGRNSSFGLESHDQVGNQLARRPVNNSVNRTRLSDPNLLTLNDQGDQSDGRTAETDAIMEQKALIAKKEAQEKRRQIPPFVQKLRSFLDDKKNANFIRWSDDGNSFIVLDEVEFAQKLIPELFKHNKYPSFVRQLNMYGFHKKVRLSDNSMRASERKSKSPSEYSNPYFKRDRPDLLWLIQKPKNSSAQTSKGKIGQRMKSEDRDDIDHDDIVDELGGSLGERSRFRGQLSIENGDGGLAKEQLAGVYHELQNIRQQQHIISNSIAKLRHEHEQLYGQAATFQEQHNKHEKSINAILTFLATVYNRSLQGHEGVQGLVNSFSPGISQDRNQANIVDVEYANLSPSQRPYKKAPLLLKASPENNTFGQTATRSPTMRSGSQYHSDPEMNSRQTSQSSTGHNIEELFDPASPPSQQPKAVTAPSNQQEQRQLPQRDIISVLQNSNTKNNLETRSEFPSVLRAMESGGQTLDNNAIQRSEIMRLIANQTNNPPQQSSQPPVTNALTSNSSAFSNDYMLGLAKSQSEIDRLTKLQADQDRSVQNLTSLLQPLTPNGSIPGLEDENMNATMGQPYDLDQFFNNADYFGDLPRLDGNNEGLENYPQPTNQNNQEQPPTSAALPNAPVNDIFKFESLPTDMNNHFSFPDTTAAGSSETLPGYYEGYPSIVPGTATSAPDPSASDDAAITGDQPGSSSITGATGTVTGASGAPNDAICGSGSGASGDDGSSQATSPTVLSVDDGIQALDFGQQQQMAAAHAAKRRKRNSTAE